MSEEDKDVKAAEGYLAIFAEQDKKIKAKLDRIFLKRFLNYYHYYKKAFRDPLDIVNMLVEITTALQSLSDKAKKITLERQAEILGESLGEFLAIMDYGIPQWNQNRKNTDIVKQCQAIGFFLKALRKSIRPTFIKNRIERIAAEHAGKLSIEQQKLFTDIAVIFAA
ncbi:MAG: hypothetical protein Q7K45_04120 [Nanoarchaeota archaeon]|nr:hypothetical protein [Nanoarchaeota archaeon]